jgi:hypothetical protein
MTPDGYHYEDTDRLCRKLMDEGQVPSARRLHRLQGWGSLQLLQADVTKWKAEHGGTLDRSQGLTERDEDDTDTDRPHAIPLIEQGEGVFAQYANPPHPLTFPLPEPDPARLDFYRRQRSLHLARRTVQLSLETLLAALRMVKAPLTEINQELTRQHNLTQWSLPIPQQVPAPHERDALLILRALEGLEGPVAAFLARVQDKGVDPMPTHGGAQDDGPTAA